MPNTFQRTLLASIALTTVAMAKTAMADETFVCPDTVRLASGTVSPDSLPAGSQALVSSEIVRLSGVSAFDGPPEQGASLKPDTFSDKGNSATWKFEAQYPDGKFVSCDYANGLVRIHWRIADAAASCTSKTEIKKPQRILKAVFRCK